MVAQSRFTIYEAEQILGLSGNYTSEDIKKAYRELTKKWHPDIRLGSNAEERMKDINEAYGILKGKYAPRIGHVNVKRNGYKKSNQVISEKLIKELKKRLDKLPDSKDYDFYFVKIGREFDDIISYYEGRIKFSTDEFVINLLYKQAIQNLNTKLRQLEELFLKNNGISKEEFGEVDYSLPIFAFIKSLLNKLEDHNFEIGQVKILKELLIDYSKQYISDDTNIQKTIDENIKKCLLYAVTRGCVGDVYKNTIISYFDNKLKNELSKYFKECLNKESLVYINSGYSFLKDKMNNIIKKILNDFKNGDIKNNILVEFQNKVSKLICEYKIIEELTEILKTLESLVGKRKVIVDSRNKLSSINKNLNLGIDVSSELNVLNHEIKTYYSIVQPADNDIIREAYLRFENGYHEKLQRLNPIIDIKTLTKTNQIFTEVINLFQSLSLETANVQEFLECIRNINLDNLDESLKNIKGYKFGKSNIFINNKPLSQLVYFNSLDTEERKFCLLQEEQGHLYMYFTSKFFGKQNIERIEISKLQLHDSFESIESVLSRSRYFGFLNRNIYGSCYMLYNFDDFYIIKDLNGNFKIKKEQDFSSIYLDIKTSCDTDYFDGQRLIMDIKKYLEEIYSGYKPKSKINLKSRFHPNHNI